MLSVSFQRWALEDEDTLSTTDSNLPIMTFVDESGSRVHSYTKRVAERLEQNEAVLALQWSLVIQPIQVQFGTKASVTVHRPVEMNVKVGVLRHW